MKPGLSTLEILDKLIAFETISANPNLALVEWLQELLCNAGATVKCLYSDSADKANLYATIGPTDKPGILLSGHTDVVPVSGQNWSVPPFAMTVKDEKVYGRGSADMKGFVASAVRIALLATQRELQTPLHLGFSYDEEIGCVGVRSMIDMLALSSVKPLMCIVGEPTEMSIAIGHKGKSACHVTCIGKAGHSALAPNAVNAIHLATELIEKLRTLQHELAASGNRDNDYDIPYTTVHVSNIRGGVALNIVPDCCTFDFEIRNLHQDDPLRILKQIETAAREIVEHTSPRATETDIRIETFNSYPGLNTNVNDSVVAFVRSLTDGNQLFKVAFGTEGGLFSSKLGIPTVVCGPGSMDQGHKPDEFVSLEQLRRCDRMMLNLLDSLEVGIS